MKNTITKITFLLMALIVLLTACQIPVMAETKNGEIEKIIYKDSNGNYLIYYKDYCENEFGYAIAATADQETAPTILKGSSKDGGEEELNVILIQVEDPNTFEGYAWITTDDEDFVVKADKIDLAEAIDDDIMAKVNSEIIKTSTDGKYETQKVEDGVTKTVKLGKVDILTDGEYEYILVPITDDSEEDELYKLAENMSQETAGTYAKLELNKKFNDYYEKLRDTESGWLTAEGKEVLQPTTAAKGDRYLVALRNKEDNEVVDIKFLISDYEYVPEYKTEDKVITETVGLPVTYDSIALIVVLAVIIIAIIVVAILRKRSNKGNH